MLHNPSNLWKYVQYKDVEHNICSSSFVVLLSSSSVTLRVKLDMVFFPLLHNYVMFSCRLHFFFLT